MSILHCVLTPCHCPVADPSGTVYLQNLLPDSEKVADLLENILGPASASEILAASVNPQLVSARSLTSQCWWRQLVWGRCSAKAVVTRTAVSMIERKTTRCSQISFSFMTELEQTRQIGGFEWCLGSWEDGKKGRSNERFLDVSVLNRTSLLFGGFKPQLIYTHADRNLIKILDYLQWNLIFKNIYIYFF